MELSEKLWNEKTNKASMIVSENVGNTMERLKMKENGWQGQQNYKIA